MRFKCSILTGTSVRLGIAAGVLQMAGTLFVFSTGAAIPFGNGFGFVLLFLPFLTCLLGVAFAHRRRYEFDPENLFVVLEHRCLLLFVAKRLEIPWSEISEVTRIKDDSSREGPSYITRLHYRSGKVEKICDCWYDDQAWFDALASAVNTQTQAVKD